MFIKNINLNFLKTSSLFCLAILAPIYAQQNNIGILDDKLNEDFLKEIKILSNLFGIAFQYSDDILDIEQDKLNNNPNITFIIGRIQGKTVGGGVGIASATDYCMATKFASIKLSELNLGIGPFVVGPAVERKLGLSGMSQIAIDANSFYSADWSKQKGLFMQVYESTEEMDKAIQSFAEKLCSYNPDAMKEMKKVFWSGTEDWDDLLAERAAISGRLVLSDFTKETLKKFN